MKIYDNLLITINDDLRESMMTDPINPSHPHFAQEDHPAKTHLLFRPKGELQQTPCIPQGIRLVLATIPLNKLKLPMTCPRKYDPLRWETNTFDLWRVLIAAHTTIQPLPSSLLPP